MWLIFVEGVNMWISLYYTVSEIMGLVEIHFKLFRH